MSVYQIYPKKKKSMFGFLERMSLTKKLIAINVFLFIFFSVLLRFGIVSIDWIAIKPANIWDGKYIWTFVTSMFMHGSFFHLFVNMLSLFFIGSLIEKILGKKRYFLFYMVAGLFAGVLFVLSGFIFSQDATAYAVGASGALFGLVGLLILLTPDLPVYVMFVPIPIKMKYAAPGMLVLLWIISISANIPIGNVAHFGGLVFGLLYGFVLKNRFPKKVKYIQTHFR